MALEETTVRSLGLLAEPARRQLYQYVARRRTPVSRDEAADAIGMSRNLAAFHLDRLAAAGLLEIEPSRAKRVSAVGRPPKLYRPGRRRFTLTLPARNYELAASLLVRVIGRQQQASVAKLARRIGRQIARASRVRSSPERALKSALERCGYEPFAAGDGVTRLANCPFHELVASRRELVCGMNVALVGGIASAIAARRFVAEFAPRTGLCCVAIVRAASRASR